MIASSGAPLADFGCGCFLAGAALRFTLFARGRSRNAETLAPLCANFDSLSFQSFDSLSEGEEEIRVRSLSDQFVVVIGDRHLDIVQMTFVSEDHARLGFASSVVK